MSHISFVETKTKFTDTAVLKTALSQFGKVIEGSRAISMVLTTPIQGIDNLTFMQAGAGTEWKARQDHWGNEAEYKKLVGKIGQQYSTALTLAFIKQRHLSLAGNTQDAENNTRIKIRSY